MLAIGLVVIGDYGIEVGGGGGVKDVEAFVGD